MAEIVAGLRKLDFPRCAQVALDKLATCYSKEDAGIPGISLDLDKLSKDVIDEFVFCEVSAKVPYPKKLTALQELQLLEILIGFFEQQTNGTAVPNSIFKDLFGVSLGGQRRNMLYKLTSTGIGLRCKSLLNYVAVWMQHQGCSTVIVNELVGAIIYDYCQLVPGAGSALHELPSISTHFTCNVITAITSAYTPHGQRGCREVTAELLELVVSWLQADPTLCLISLINVSNGGSASSQTPAARLALWTSPTKPNNQTPIPGLVRWCTQAPLLQPSDDSLLTTRMNVTWSQLHLAVLSTIATFTTLPGANQLELITVADMKRIVRESTLLVQQRLASDKKRGIIRMDDDEEGDIQVAMDRLAQVLQVSIATGGFRCSLSDLRNICDMIPPSRLMEIIKVQHLAVLPPPMHHELH